MKTLLSFILLFSLVVFLLPLAALNPDKASTASSVQDFVPPIRQEEPVLASPSQESSPAVEQALSQQVSQPDHFSILDRSTGEVTSIPVLDYLYGAVAAELPPDFHEEAMKAQTIAAHTYALYCRDHAALQSGAWLAVDPARRQGCLTEPVLRSYWGTAYEQNYARLSALVDEVLNDLLFYDNAPACTSYFAISNGRTEASENVWGTALPYLIPVDSGTDLSADNYQYTAVFSVAQVQQAFSGLGITADLAAPESWFGPVEQTSSGYTKSLTVCGQTVSGTALRQALGLRSTCFTVQYQSGNFSFTTRGYGHGVGLSQWGAKAMAEQDADYADILAHYYPGTQLHRMGS